LYPLPDTPALDAYTNLRHWLEFLTHYYHQGKPLSSDQLIFPSITSKTGDIHFSTPLSVERVNQFLEEFGKSANIGGGFTSHCFQRGGIQYRFLFAPVHERWTLDQCRWWGGWANNENVSTYLVNHLFSTILIYVP